MEVSEDFTITLRLGQQPLSITIRREDEEANRAAEKLINQKLYIPSFPPERETSESLNVAIATAVICAEFRRCQGNAAQ